MGSRSARRATAAAAATRFLSELLRRIAPLALAAMLCAVTAPASAADPPHEALEHFPTSTLTIDAGGRSYPFKVWMATTDERREQGLMYVRHLAPERGMLFVFDVPQLLNFWMKNTHIPLDLLFIAADGRVTRIAENAEPESLAQISSMGASLGVLELAGGSVARLGLRPGVRIVHPAFAAH
jgi:uncharacterized membrane protein (UPF0127 family)